MAAPARAAPPTDTEGTDGEGTDTKKGTDTEGTDGEGTDTKGTDTKGTDGEGTDTKTLSDPDDPAIRAEKKRVDQAIRHFVEGQRLYDAGQYVDAAHEFERSYTAIRSGLTLYNIALSYEKGGLHVPAIQAAMQYLELPDCEALGRAGPTRNCTTRRGEVEQTVERLRRQVSELVLAVEPNVELDEVRISGRVVPLEDFPLLLTPGPVEVEVRGTQPDQLKTRIVRLNPGETSRLYIGPFPAEQVVVRPDPGSNPPPSEDPRVVAERRAFREAEERRTRALRIAFWTGTAFTAASGVATAVLGGLTAAAKKDYDEGFCEEPCVCVDPPCYPFAERDRFESLKPATNAMAGVTAGLGLVTVVVGILAFTRGSRGSDRRPSASGSSAQTSSRVRLRLTGRGFAVHW